MVVVVVVVPQGEGWLPFPDTACGTEEQRLEV